jgi:hypothetical protein
MALDQSARLLLEPVAQVVAQPLLMAVSVVLVALSFMATTYP